jgi:sulfite reductase alpha subunit-like flavoprotein
MAPKKIVIVHGGELAKDVAEQIAALKPATSVFEVTLRCASERPKTLLNYSASDDSGNSTVLCFVMQTIENEGPTEEGGSVLRFFKRKTHPSDLLASTSFAVLGVGDSNLLLDRQTTGSKDCNQVAVQLDSRLEALGGTRLCPLGMADERTGLTEVDPWIKDVFWKSLS